MIAATQSFHLFENHISRRKSRRDRDRDGGPTRPSRHGHAAQCDGWLERSDYGAGMKMVATIGRRTAQSIPVYVRDRKGADIYVTPRFRSSIPVARLARPPQQSQPGRDPNATGS